MHVHTDSGAYVQISLTRRAPRASAGPTDVKENTAGKQPDTVQPGAMRAARLWTAEYIHWLFSHTVIYLPRPSM